MSRLRTPADSRTEHNLDTAPSVVLECADPAVLAAFWAAALGYAADPGGEPDVLVDPAGAGPSLRLRPSGPATTRQPRLRPELEVTGSGPFVRQQALVEAEVARLVGLGAHVVGRVSRDVGAYGVVLADPEGNEFSIG